MIKRKLLYVLTLPFITLIILTLLSFGYYSIDLFENFFLNSAKDELKAKTLIIKKEFTDHYLDQLVSADINALRMISDELDQTSGTRITLVRPDGKVLYDTREDASKMDNHLDRPEIKDALIGEVGYANRFSYTLQMQMLYTATLLLNKENKVVGIMRTGLSIDKINSALNSKIKNIVIAGIIILILASIIGVLLSREIAKPLLEMKEFAEGLSRGELEKKIYSPRILEIESLGNSLNLMASQLNEKIRTISEQKNIQQAILEGMKEGVLAADVDERILFINGTAGNILNIAGQNVKGRTLQEVVRIPDIQRFVSKIFLERSHSEAEITIKGIPDKIIQLIGTVLLDSDRREIGTLVVMNDVTDLKRLDNLKRDFVANISHELRTPITTIKGFIETLKEGAIDDPKNSKRFLKIISKHSDRLNNIIEDLLSLSRLEQPSAVEEIRLITDRIRPIVLSVSEDFEAKANEKNITLRVDCPKEITAKINPPLIEEAVGNLLDNAIKYSKYGTTVTVTVSEAEKWVTITVKDEGPGIPQEHLPRLFERFYRVDHARSRDEGGTGLGLAIVKHIAQVHNGLAEVESELGKGSMFRIRIPSIEKH